MPENCGRLPERERKRSGSMARHMRALITGRLIVNTGEKVERLHGYEDRQVEIEAAIRPNIILAHFGTAECHRRYV